MSNPQILQWFLFGLSLLAGIGTILAWFKLHYAERFLPRWDELKDIEAKLPVRREELQQANETISALRQEWAKLEGEVGHLHQLREWEKANPEAPAKIRQMIVDLQRNNSELAAVQQKLAQDEARLGQITQEVTLSTQEKNLLTEQIKTLREQIATSQKEKGDLEKTIRDLDDRRRQLDSRLVDQRGEVQSQELRLNTLRQQVEKAEQEKAAAFRERDQARADRDSAKAEFEGLKKSLETYKALLDNLQTELRQTGVTGQGNYEDLFVRVPFPPLVPARASSAEQRALQSACDYIRGKGLVFPKRVLHAFHTSLKSSDISPLVVLAGISGTGKSELPRHYADSMGIHLLITAVQPRWDSPQDLFGFYNYLERRYKATELARALVQFECFNQGEIEDAFENAVIEDRSDRILLVLLDEMNLARTEYYFSEFLSKLETRRMVNEDNAEDRARAEFALDMGSMLDGQKSLRLYPGRNVLFVGTMNEDESTQSLSDKVIDRASVIRFGRPEKTHPETIGGIHARPTNGLTFANWEEWLRKPTDLGQFSAEVDAWIGQLNNALDRLGRPFAYRVDRAIRTYIANYPRWVGEWHKRAMADQIEQRIFPKLRGIEPEQGEAPQALKTIGNIIRQLDDAPLAKAFDRSHLDQPTFLFRGVSRSEDE